MTRKLVTASSNSLLILIGMTFIGCVGFGDRDADAELYQASVVDWSDIEPLFTLRCNGCHNDPPLVGAPYPLLTYDQVASRLDLIAEQIFTLEVMPPGGLSDPTERALLRRWIDLGAPKVIPEFYEDQPMTAGQSVKAGEEAGEPGGVTPLPRPTWDADIKSLFEIYCNNCHADPPTGGAPFALKTYEQVAPYLGRFQVRVIERADMPPGGIRDVADLMLIQRWLEEGGPER